MVPRFLLLFSLCLIHICLSGQIIPTNGMVVHYPFNGDHLDASGNDLHLSMIGDPIPCPDRHGNPNSAYFLDGSGDYFFVEDDPLLRPFQYTVSAWFCSTGLNQYGRILEKRYSIPSFPWTSFLLEYNRDLHTAETQLTTNTGRVVLNSSGSAPANEWCLLTVTFDGDSLRLYLNGQLDTAIPKTGNVSYSSESLFIGVAHGGCSTAYCFDGAIDDVLIYNRPLTNTEILDMYVDVPVPENVVLTASGSGINLYWNAVPGSVTYNVYSAPIPDAVFPAGYTLEQAGLIVCSWIDSASIGEQKYYVVTAVKE